MLSMMRSSVGGWFAKILIFLLVASFAVYGVSESFFGNNTDTVVTVGETKISALNYRLAYDRQLAATSRRFGVQLTRQQAEGFGVTQSVLNDLVSGAVLDENTRMMGLGISNDRLAGLIGTDANFHDATGQFSRGRLQSVLRNIGMSEAAYVDTRKSAAVRSQLIEGVSNSAQLPNSFFDIVAKAQGQKRVFEYIKLEKSDLKDQAEATDEQLKSFYEENLTRYVAPEYRKANIVTLQATDIVDEESVTDEEIAQEYERKKQDFTTVEKRKIQQLVYVDEAKAIEDLARIRAGETFETIMQEQGKTEADVDLGLVARTDVADINVAKAAFDLELNATSEVVGGIFGSVLVRTIEIQPEKVRSLEEVKDDLRKSIALRIAEDSIFESHDKFEDERAAGESLQKAAENVGLKLRVIEAIDRNARDIDGEVIADLPESRKLVSEIFDTDVGTETSPISIGSSGFVWFEVDAITEERQKPFEEVEVEVGDHWNERETDNALTAMVEEIGALVKDGKSFNDAVEEIVPVTSSTADEPITTSTEDATQTPETDTPKAVTPSRIKKSLKLAASDTSADLNAAAISLGYSDQQGAVVAAAPSEGEGKLALFISEVSDETEVALEDNAKSQLNNQLGNDILTGLIGVLQTKQEVLVNQTAINAALNYGHSSGGY